MLRTWFIFYINNYTLIPIIIISDFHNVNTKHAATWFSYVSGLFSTLFLCIYNFLSIIGLYYEKHVRIP